jgi:hypothetical protein
VHPVLLFAVSIAAGFVGAMSGMGGGVVLVPALTLLGIDIKHAIAISIVSVIATSSGSAAAYVRDHITNLKVGMFLEMFTILGALVGAAITLAINPNLLFLAFGLVLLASWTALFLQRNEAWQPVAHVDRFSRIVSLVQNVPEKHQIERCVLERQLLSGRLPELRTRGKSPRQRQQLGIRVDARHSQAAVGKCLGEDACSGPHVQNARRRQPIQAESHNPRHVQTRNPFGSAQAVRRSAKSALVRSAIG